MNVELKVYIVAYDITADERRTKIYRILRGYGDHLQFSVFRCTLSPLQQRELEARLIEVISAREDQVLFVPIGGPDSDRVRAMRTLGLPLTQPDRVVKVIG